MFYSVRAIFTLCGQLFRIYFIRHARQTILYFRSLCLCTFITHPLMVTDWFNTEIKMPEFYVTNTHFPHTPSRVVIDLLMVLVLVKFVTASG
jgi:hypothetical protein